MTAFDAVIVASDQALFELDGEPFVLRVARALSEAASVTTIGGDLVALSQLGLEAAPASRPANGPLGAVVQAMEIGEAVVVVVVTSDLPYLGGGTVRALVEAVGDHDAAVATVDGERQPLLAAWRRKAVTVALSSVAASLDAVLAGVDVVEVEIDGRAAGMDPVGPPDDTAAP